MGTIERGVDSFTDGKPLVEEDAYDVVSARG
jgi:hypothetical protein